MAPIDTGLPIGEAADHLGITTTALRKRIRRGTVQAHKHGGVWRIVLPANGQPDTPAGSPPNGEPTRANGQSAGEPGVLAELRAHVATLQERVTFLERLTEHQAGVIGELTRRMPELPAPSARPPEPSPHMPTAAPRRRWWAVWEWGKAAAG